MPSKTKKIDTILFLGVVLLFLLLPFHAFLKTTLTSLITDSNLNWLSKGSFLIAAWKEVLIVLLAFLVTIKSLRDKQFPFKITKLDILIMAFFVLAIISLIFQTKNLTVGIWGLKTDLEFFVIYFIVRSMDLKMAHIKTLLKIILGSAIVVTLFGLLLIWVLPQDFMLHFGYTRYISSYMDYKPLPVYHGLGENLETMRLASTLSGPNQLGAYLLLITGLLFGLLLHYKAKIITFWEHLTANPYVLWFALIISTICIIYTFSRAAWLGFAAILLTILILFFKKKPKITITLLSLGIVGIIMNIILFFVWPNYFNKILLHGASSVHHAGSTRQAFEIIAEHPLGLGIGMAGPVSRRMFGQDLGIISENWYLQIAEEMGIIGGLLFVAIIVFLAIYIFKAYKKETDIFYKGFLLAMFLALIGISVNANFLHTWDDSTTALMFWGLAGIAVNKYLERESVTQVLKSKALQYLLKE